MLDLDDEDRLDYMKALAELIKEENKSGTMSNPGG